MYAQSLGIARTGRHAQVCPWGCKMRFRLEIALTGLQSGQLLLARRKG